MSGWARYVWRPDYNDRPETENVIGVMSVSSAAEEEARDIYPHDDYPNSQTVHVVDDDGRLFVFEVEAVQDVYFRAVERKP